MVLLGHDVDRRVNMAQVRSRPADGSRAGRILNLVSQPTANGGTRFTDVRWFERLDSTNRYVLDEAARGAAEGLVVVAGEQTHGRGRLGRVWVAPPGASLLVSVLLRPDLAPERSGLLTMAAGLAVIDAVATLGGIDARLKWPNDVVVDDRKLAGILAERSDGAVVIGMGCNVRWDDFPPDLTEIATACNLLTSAAVDVDDVLAGWLRALDVRLDALDRVLTDARRRSATIGRRVHVELADAAFDGDAVGLTDDGHLRVRDGSGEVCVVAAGDIVHLRPQ
jgi:BirA family biotin operon repressor/biotin-[acetyl-CoA-carboxylase] ligase